MDDAVRELMAATRKAITELESRLDDADKWRREVDPRTCLGVLEHCSTMVSRVQETLSATRTACRLWHDKK